MKPLTFKLSAMGTTGTQLFLMNCYYILQKEDSVWLTYKFTHSTTTTTPKKVSYSCLKKLHATIKDKILPEKTGESVWPSGKVLGW